MGVIIEVPDNVPEDIEAELIKLSQVDAHGFAFAEHIAECFSGNNIFGQEYDYAYDCAYELAQCAEIFMKHIIDMQRSKRRR